MARDNRIKKLKELGPEAIKKQNREKYEKDHNKAQKLRKKVISFYSNQNTEPTH